MLNMQITLIQITSNLQINNKIYFSNVTLNICMIGGKEYKNVSI